MNLRHWLEERRYAAVWRDSERSRATLLSFSRTERDGGRDLEAAAEKMQDPEALGHLIRHANDEARHADLFHQRWVELQGAGLPAGCAAPSRSSKASNPPSAKPGSDGVNAHGFFPASLFDEMGEVGFLTMLHVAEKRAAHLFARHHRAATKAGDPQTAQIFESILRDEKYHVAWTGKVLERWRGEGRGAEVSRGLAQAGRGRMIGSWRRLGLRSAAGFTRMLLMLLYWTLLAPFGWIASRRVRPASGWVQTQGPERAGQY